MSTDDGQLPVKLYYRIGEVSQIVGVEPHVLRYWESEFRSIRPQKSRKGQRIYSRRDVDKLIRVKDLLYTHGFTIAGARKRLREGGAEPETQDAARALAPAAAVPPAPAVTLRSRLLEIRSEVLSFLQELELDGASDRANAS